MLSYIKNYAPPPVGGSGIESTRLAVVLLKRPTVVATKVGYGRAEVQRGTRMAVLENPPILKEQSLDPRRTLNGGDSIEGAMD
jgi:hypothetical protein